MRKLCCLPLLGMCLLAVVANTQAQKFEVKWADPIETPKIHFLQHLSSPDDGNFYTVHYSKSQEGARIRTYNPDMKLSAEHGLKTGLQERVYTYFSFAGHKDVFHLMAETKKDREIAAVLAHSNGTAIAGGNNIPAAAPFKLSDWSLAYRTQTSDNGKFVLVYNSRYNKSDKLNNYAYKVFRAEDGSILHQGSFDVRLLTEIFETYHIDNKGNVYFIVKKGVGFRPKDREAKPGMDLLVFNTRGEKTEHPLNPLLMTAPAIDVVNTEGTVFISGFLYLASKNDSIGSASLLILQPFDNSRMTIGKTETYRVNDLFPAGRLKQEDRLPYKIKAVHEKSNGNLVFTAEQVKYFISNTGGGSFSHHFDMAAVEVTPQAKEAKTWRIPKFQFSGDENQSFVSTLLNDNLYLLYSDRLTNTTILSDKEVDATASRDTRNGLFAVIIRSSGEAEKKLVYAYGEKNSAPLIMKSKQTKPGQVMLAGQNSVGVLRISE